MNTRHKFFPVERFGQIIIGPEPKPLDLAFGIVRAGQDQNRRIDACEPQLTQHIMAIHIGQTEVQQNEVVIVKLGQIDAFFAQIRRIDVQVGMCQHQFDAFRCGRVVFNQKHAHLILHS